MYFDPIRTDCHDHWLHGLSTGLHDWAGVPFCTQHRKAALDARGLEMKAPLKPTSLQRVAFHRPRSSLNCSKLKLNNGSHIETSSPIAPHDSRP